MATVREKICELLRRKPGLTDSEIVKELGLSRHQHANNEIRNLEREGVVMRIKVRGLIRNYLVRRESAALEGDTDAEAASRMAARKAMSEDEVKLQLQKWLQSKGWDVAVAMGKERGPDIAAAKGRMRWLVEVKGLGSRPQMNINYFLAVLGQIPQRMEDGCAHYSVAFPDQPVFRRLWSRLPRVAKERTLVSALFVGPRGEVDEVR